MPHERVSVNLPRGNSQLTRAIRLLAKHKTYGQVRFDVFRQAIIKPDDRVLDDFDYIKARVWLCEQTPPLPARAEIVVAALMWLASASAYDSLVEHIEALPEWDGQPRLDRWLTAWLGASDDPLTRWIGRKFLISAMARAYKPGCKVDHVLVLHGPNQGEGKSKIVADLGGAFTREMTCSVADKDAKVQLQGAWFVEFADLGSLPRSEINAVKGFISQPIDSYRPPYGRQTLPFPRRCVFVVTTNDLDFVSDASGARRFWPVTCNPQSSAFVYSESGRNQLLSEARNAYFEGELWWPQAEEAELCGDLKNLQDELQQEDTWFGVVAKFTDGRDEVTTREVLEGALGIANGDQNRGHVMRIAACLKRLKYERNRAVNKGSGATRGYVYRRVDLPGPTGP